MSTQEEWGKESQYEAINRRAAEREARVTAAQEAIKAEGYVKEVLDKFIEVLGELPGVFDAQWLFLGADREEVRIQFNLYMGLDTMDVTCEYSLEDLVMDPDARIGDVVETIQEFIDTYMFECVMQTTFDCHWFLRLFGRMARWLK